MSSIYRSMKPSVLQGFRSGSKNALNESITEMVEEVIDFNIALYDTARTSINEQGQRYTVIQTTGVSLSDPIISGCDYTILKVNGRVFQVEYSSHPGRYFTSILKEVK